jgi:hypothetical protein
MSWSGLLTEYQDDTGRAGRRLFRTGQTGIARFANLILRTRMTWILFTGGIVIGGAAVGVALLARRAARAPDPAWRSTGYRYTTGRHYLQAQGIANALEARKYTASGRRYRRHLETVGTQAESVVVAPRRLAGVIQFGRRQA